MVMHFKNMKRIFQLLILSWVLAPAVLFAQGPVCPGVRVEGSRAIPETAFTREEAGRSLRILNELTRDGAKGADWDIVENNLKMVKGYLYKVFLDAHKAELGKEDSVLKQQFCEFLKTEAFLQH